ncbi:MAG: hypothetical protein F9K32_06010 [Desulfobulbaceae bacterium]|nr:MAG: hypothetical protein F9K32_06010 [Desulfobulbaceae bacterium]
MRHNNYITGLYGEWTIILMIFGFLIVIAGCIWFLHRRTVASDGLTPKERDILSTQEREIVSLVRQNGGPMRQNEMIDMLPGGIEMLSEIFNALEKKGLIKRKWESREGTYIVISQT